MKPIPPAFWAAIAAAGLAIVVAGGRAATGSQKPPPGPTPGPTPPPGGCAYKPIGAALPKAQDERTRRVAAIIKRINPRAAAIAIKEHKYVGPDYSFVLAEALMVMADQQRIPLDLFVALCQRESNFNYLLGYDHVTKQLEGLESCPTPWPKVGDRAAGLAIGPLQVKPIAACQVSFNFSRLITQGWTDPMRVWIAVQAGARYLRWTADQLPGHSWCDVLHAYYTGVAGFKAGRRNQPYVNDIVRYAADYSELRRPDV